MKKRIMILLIFVIIINLFTVFVNAEVNNYEELELIEQNNVVTDVVGKIVDVKAPKDLVTGSVTDRVQEVTVQIIDEGEYFGDEFTTNYILSYDIDGKILAYELEKGDKVIVEISKDAEGNQIVTVLDVVRSNYIIILFGLFLLSIVLVGGRKGVKAILGLILTIALIYFMLLKGIFSGTAAIKISVLTIMLIIAGTFIIIGNGINKKIITASLGTLGGVLSAGIIALIFNRLAKMTGACEDAIQLSINMTSINFNFRDLLFVGIVISALGACMDVGMSIASSLDEIKMKNPEITWKELLKSGMNIGRDVIGTMTNTLILAYVGGSMTLILLFMACDMTPFEILNKETIAEQVISAIAGSMGVVFTVPITSFVYSVLNKDQVIYKKSSENKINGKRSLKI